MSPALLPLPSQHGTVRFHRESPKEKASSSRGDSIIATMIDRHAVRLKILAPVLILTLVGASCGSSRSYEIDNGDASRLNNVEGSDMAITECRTSGDNHPFALWEFTNDSDEYVTFDFTIRFESLDGTTVVEEVSDGPRSISPHDEVRLAAIGETKTDSSFRCSLVSFNATSGEEP